MLLVVTAIMVAMATILIMVAVVAVMLAVILAIVTAAALILSPARPTCCECSVSCVFTADRAFTAY